MADEQMRIKFCGITRPSDAEAAAELGAWAVGMILWPGSGRAVGLDRGAEIAATVRRRVEIVGVFVNPTLEEVADAADVIGLTIVQLHGLEGPVFCGEVARRTGARVIKAARVHSKAEIQALEAFHTDFHLLDSYVPGVPGGTGETFEWGLASGHRPKIPMILSGGLTADNVGAAIGLVHPYAVDVSSGVESSPGIKSIDALRRFVQAASDAVAIAG